MKRLILLCTAALLGCSTPPPTDSVKTPDGMTWRYDAEARLWRDALGRTAQFDPRTPLCGDVTLKKDTRTCVVRR
jgi:hypothetical protein